MKENDEGRVELAPAPAGGFVMSSQRCRRKFWKLAERLILTRRISQDTVLGVWDARGKRGKNWCVHLVALRKLVREADEQRRLFDLERQRDPLHGGL